MDSSPPELSAESPRRCERERPTAPPLISPTSPPPSVPSCFVRVRLAGFEGFVRSVIDDATEREIRGTFLAQRRDLSKIKAAREYREEMG